jgi:hypothetical protein
VGHRTDSGAVGAHLCQQTAAPHKDNDMMIAPTMETGWKRFLDRIRKLWEVPAHHNATPQPLEHEVSASRQSDDAPPVSQR